MDNKELSNWLGLNEPHCKNCKFVGWNPDSLRCNKLGISEIMEETPCNGKYYESKIKWRHKEN